MSEGSPEIAETLSLLAHDLKNPLAAVMTNLGFVRGFVDDLDPANPPSDAELTDAREALLDALLACEALQRFVTNLVVVGRDLGGGRPTELQPLDLLALADQIAARHRNAAESRRIDVVVAGSGWGRGDRDNIVRALDNVVANAMQHAPGGTTVTVEVAAHGDDVAITVLDDGGVIPPALREEAVTRAGQSRAKGEPAMRYGRGLALYAASTAARAGAGRLEVGERRGKSSIAIVLARFEDGT
jgi:two-component system heavy metal sensor histidine kinase CusS